MKNGVYNKANSILELRGGVVEKKRDIMSYLLSKKDDVSLDRDPIIYAVLQDLFADEVDGINVKDRFYLRDHVVEELSRLDQSQYLRYLRYRYSYEIYPTIKKITKYPPLVQIEPTSICNYRCVFCYQIDARLSDKKNGHMGVMNLDLFKKIVDQAEGNVEFISIASRGEPLA